MSYCRGEGDIYAYPTGEGAIVCVGCAIPAPRLCVFRIAGGGFFLLSGVFEEIRYAKGRPWVSRRVGDIRRLRRVDRLRGFLQSRPAVYLTRSEFVRHLDLHIELGDDVPGGTRELVMREIEECGEVVARESSFRIPFRAHRKTVKSPASQDWRGFDGDARKLHRHILRLKDRPRIL